MDWKNQLTRTPYLVLFMILISIGVGTASALITITLSGDVHVIGDTTIDGDLLIGTNDGSDIDTIRFDQGSETILWDDPQSRFEVGDDLTTGGVLTVGHFDPVSYNRIGGGISSGGMSGINDLFVTDDLEVDDILVVNGILAAKDDVVVDGDLTTQAVLTVGGVFAPVSYNRIGGGIISGGMSGVNDLFITDDLEVNDILVVNGILAAKDDIQLDGDLVCDECIDTADLDPNAVLSTIFVTDEFEVIGVGGADFSVSMLPLSNSMCYLTGVKFGGGLTFLATTCEVVRGSVNNEFTWILKGSSLEDDYVCTARCILWG